jgi:drug/metabolite transporter (DMT)-like permease
MVAAVPLWMALLDWLRPGGRRPGARVAFGLVLGFAGIALLVGPSRLGGDRVDPVGATILLVASLSWAIGSLYSRHAPLPSSIVLAMAMQSLAGGAMLFVAAIPAGHWTRLDVAAVSLRAAGALAALVVAGSIMGFTCYLWLLRVTSAARVSTYAYVNPVVALALGWLVAGEALTPRALVAAAIIVAAVVMIVSYKEKREHARPEDLLPRAETADLGCAAPAPPSRT